MSDVNVTLPEDLAAFVKAYIVVGGYANESEVIVAALQLLRDRVAAAGRASGLFDMAAYARDFESLLTAMFRHFERGDEPRDLEVHA